MRLFGLIAASAVALSALAFSTHGQKHSIRMLRAEHPEIGATAAPGTEGGRTRRLCRLLTRLVPEVEHQLPPIAQAHVTSSVASLFENDPDALKQVFKELDDAAVEGCPAARADLLTALNMRSLRDAVPETWMLAAPR